jgi:hypothetical protein
MICPDFKNPIEKQQFLEIESIFGNNVSSWLWHFNNGHPLNKTSSGEDSVLFKEIYDIVGNKKTAMLLKAQIYQKGFIAQEPTLKEFTDQFMPKKITVSHSVHPKKLEYGSVHRAMVEEAIGNMITGKKIKAGDHRNEVRFEFEDEQQNYEVAKSKALKINEQYGQGTATLDTRNPKSITMFVNFKPETIIEQLTLETELARQRMIDQNESDMFTRQIEGNWQTNDEGNVIPYTEYDTRDYMPLNVSNQTFSFPNTFDEFLAEKQAQLKQLEDTQNRLRKEAKASKRNQEIINKLNDLRFRITALKTTINNVKRDGLFSVAFSEMVKSDFERIEKLLQNNDGDSLLEAKRMIDYYISVGIMDRDGNSNPLFAAEGISLADAPDDIKNALVKASTKAEEYNDIYIEKLKDVAYQTLINHPNYAKLYPDDISMSQLFEKVDDIDYFSEYFLSVDFTFTGNDSILAQIIKELFERKLLEKIAVAKGIIENIDDLLPRVNRLLIEMGEYRRDFLTAGRKIPLYSIFYQKNDLGNLTPALIDKFSQDWYNFVSSISFAVDQAWKSGKTYDEVNSAKYKEIHKKGRLFDITKLPSLFSTHTAFKGSKVPWANTTDEQAYINELVSEMGQTKFDEIVEQQIIKLDEYNSYVAMFRNDLIKQYGSFNQNVKDELEREVFSRSPLRALFANKDGMVTGNSGNTYSVTLEFSMYIPKKGLQRMYNDDFSVIENNPLLLQFWGVMREAVRNINESVPFKAKYATSILSMNQGILEAVIDKRIGQKSKLVSLAGIKEITYNALHNTFSTKNNDFDEDLLAKENDQNKVNDSKFKSVTDRISSRVEKETEEASSILNLKLNNTTMVDLNTASPEMIEYLARLFNVKATRSMVISAVNRGITPYATDIYIVRAIRAEVGRQEMLKETLNLPKVLKYYLAQAAHYDAANEIIPMLGGLKNLYNQIKTKSGSKRVRAEKRMNEWFDRVIRGYRVRENPQKGILVLSTEEKKERARLLRMIKRSSSQQEIDKYNEEIEKLGSHINVNSIWNVINSLIVFNGLTYNIRSSMFNYTYGYLQSMFIDQLGDHWTPGNFQAAFNFVLGKGRKNLYKTGGKLFPGWKEHAKQIEIAQLFINKSYIINDMRNEKQKASTNLGKKEFGGGAKNILKPYYISVTAVEWRNQTANILSVLMDAEIEDIHGNKHKVFDGNKFTCYEHTSGKLKLKAEFAKPENIENWENMNGDQFKTFHISASSAIRKVQGDYSPIGGMMVKSGRIGKTAMIFQTWLPMVLWTRYGKGKNLASGTNRKRPIYRRHNPFTLAMLAGVVTTAFVATNLPMVAGATIGTLIAATIVRRFAKNISVKPDINYAMELVMTMKALTMKTLGIPTNLILRSLPINIKSRKELLKPNIEKDFGLKLEDAKAMQFILTEIAVVLNAIMMKMAVVAALNCDEKTISCERRMKIKNFLDNTFTRIIAETAFYLNPLKIIQNFRDGSFLMYLDKVGGFLPAVNKFLEGEDIIMSGEYTGESRLLRLADKTLVPSILSINHLSPIFDSSVRKKISDDPGYLLDVAMPHQIDYTANDFFDVTFSTDRQKADRNIENKRAKLKRKLKRQGYSDEYINRMKNQNHPTVAQYIADVKRKVDKGELPQSLANQQIQNFINNNK